MSRATRGWLAGIGMLVALGACDRSQGPVPPVLAPVEQADGRVEFEGMQSCADCEGIRTQLVLAREAGERQYVLTETYLAPQPVPFVSRGQWRREGELVLLQADDGARLGYAVLGNGDLQPRDARGRRLDTHDGDGVLVATSTTSER